MDGQIAGACSFEPGLCGWKDTSVGKYQWSRNKGSTVTAGTGPSVDNTCGNTSCKFLMKLLLLHPSSCVTISVKKLSMYVGVGHTSAFDTQV